MTPRSPTEEEAWRSRAGWVLAAVLLALLFFGDLMPATDYFRSVPGDLGDPRFNSVLLEHLYGIVAGHGGQLWNPQFYYPFTGILGFSDNHFGSALPYLLARFAGLPREQAFDFWYCAGVLLNFASALYCLRRFGVSIAAAGLGAFFYACALPVPAQIGHAQLGYRFAAPIAVLALWRAFDRKRVVDLAWTVFFVVWQFYCSIYLGLFLAYLLVALTIALLVLRRPFGMAAWRTNAAAEPWRTKLAALSAVLLSGLALLYLLGAYYQISSLYKLEHWPPSVIIGRMLPRLGSYILADGSPLLAWLGSGVRVPMRWEHQLFIGFGATALIAVAVAAELRDSARARRLAWPMLFALGVLFIVTLRVADLSLYYLIVDLPGIKSIRAVSRVILVMLIPMSLLVAFGADSLWQRVAHRPRALGLLGALALLVVVEPLSAARDNTPIAEWRRRVEAAKALLPQALPNNAILFLRTASEDVEEQIHTELDAMVLGQDLRHPVLNGYSAFRPPGYRIGACESPEFRLAVYSHFMGDVDVTGYIARVVVLNLDPCP